MDTFDECSVLIPTATLEDIGDCRSDSDARSLLAAWTALWHPALLAQTEQLPSWYRADSPPAPDGPRVIAVPAGSLESLTSDFRQRCENNSQCRWIEGETRAEYLVALDLDAEDPETLQHQGRNLSNADFFAAGFVALQIQIMTRRLRYTSNLDEIFLQTRMVAAAKAFVDRDGEAATAALHEVFDCLAEERDHYFSSDPHLIDLALLTPEVLDQAIESEWLGRWTDAISGDESSGVLATPKNLLLDGPVAKHLLSGGARYDALRDALRLDQIGWAGGGPADPSEPLDSMTLQQAEQAFAAGTELAADAVGESPTVYARLSGSTPADLAHGLIHQGYRGVLPIDFAGGTGFGDEAKVLLSTGAGEIEALTAKPIDAASDRAFLTIGAQLGEAIDTGEVATGLLVHWPDRVCDSFLDLRRAASWGVALGRFWTLPGYFRDGERPYHSASLKALSKDAPSEIAKRIDENNDTLASMAESFRETVRGEADRVRGALARLANPKLDWGTEDESVSVLRAFELTPADETTANAICLNPHATGSRNQIALAEGAPGNESFIYATSGNSQRCEVTFDTPAFGFTRLTASQPVPQAGWLKRLTGGGKTVAEAGVLRNEFMAVSLSETSGGIEGVYSGSRGNRLSMQLVACRDGDHEDCEMVARSTEVIESTLTAGVLRSQGVLQSIQSGEVLANYTLSYTLRRGRRVIEIEGLLEPAIQSSENSLWKNHIAVRAAVADEATLFRPIVRDKVHSASQRRMLAPLGVVLDEAERQTLVTGHGLPLHRKVGDRFLDTVVCPIAEEPTENGAFAFELSYAFDSKHPVAAARSFLAPAVPQSLTSSPDASTQQAWLLHCSPRELILSDLAVLRRGDGKTALRVKIVQPRPKSSRVSLRCCFDAETAFLLDHQGIDRPLDSLDDSDSLTIEEGVVSFTLGGHQTVSIGIILKT
ncbi:MAG: hypothetical protein AAFU85_08695 [Planctomycetota bacterium]